MTGKYGVKYHFGDWGADGRITLRTKPQKYVLNKYRKG